MHAVLGIIQIELGMYDKAADSLKKATAGDPFDIASKQRLSVLVKAEGIASRTEAHLHLQMARRWLEAGLLDCAIAAAILAARSGAPSHQLERLNAEIEALKTAPRSPATYIRSQFDQFASSYDETLVGRLGYAAPAILRQLAAPLLPAARGTQRILDLGCGTGLAGIAFKDFAKHLTGVDLSLQMLAKARERGVYDMLVEADIEALPQTVNGPFDLIVAADVVVYLGDLTRIFKTARTRLQAGGYWMFTCERSDGEAFRRGTSDRFCHSAPYLQRCAEEDGFSVETLVECVPRHEKGAPVAGLAGIFRAK